VERFLLESLLLALFSRTPVPPFALSLPVHYRVLSLRDVRLVFFLVFGGPQGKAKPKRLTKADKAAIEFPPYI